MVSTPADSSRESPGSGLALVGPREWLKQRRSRVRYGTVSPPRYSGPSERHGRWGCLSVARHGERRGRGLAPSRPSDVGGCGSSRAGGCGGVGRGVQVEVGGGRGVSVPEPARHVGEVAAVTAESRGTAASRRRTCGGPSASQATPTRFVLWPALSPCRAPRATTAGLLTGDEPAVDGRLQEGFEVRPDEGPADRRPPLAAFWGTVAGHGW